MVDESLVQILYFVRFVFFVCFVREEGLSGLFRHAAFGGSNW
jgi:hypothetical protein